MIDDKQNDNDTQLEENVAKLLEQAHEPPRMRAEARARILDELKAKAQAPAGEQPAEAPAGERPAKEPVRGKLLAFRPNRRWIAVGALGVAASVVLAWALGGGPIEKAPAVHRNTQPAPRRVMLADGSELILDHSTQVTELGPRHLRLAGGEAMLDVRPGAGQFVVEAPHGRVVVLGTRFLISADEKETRAAVVRGQVRLENASGTEVLHAGEEGVIRGGERPTRRPAPRLSFLSGWARQAFGLGEGAPDEPSRNGTLLARDPIGWGSQEFPLEVRDFTVDVHVEDGVARTTIDQTFFNHVNRQLEGVYQFPLPPEASISRLAMYVDGKLMEGGIIERQRGRDVYESIVYRRRDPALLEWMQGNLFKVRIFPLPARTEKRILLSYTETLPRLYDAYRLVVPVPAVDKPVGRVSFKVRVVGGARYEILSSSHEVATQLDGSDTIVSFEAEGAAIGDDLILSLREKQPKETRVAVDGDYVQVRTQPDVASSAGERKWQPRDWVLLVDGSASIGARERAAQAFLVDRLLQELDEEDRFTVIAFDVKARELAGGLQGVAAADRKAVRQFLDKGERGVGATNLEAALDAALAALASGRNPHILYIGDGVITDGESAVSALGERIAGKATFIGVALGEAVDLRTLRGLAASTGGLATSFNLGEDLAWRTFDLVASLNTPRVVDLTAMLLDAGGRPLDGVTAYLSSAQLADGEDVEVLAKLRGVGSAMLALEGRVDGKKWSRTIALPETAGGARWLPRTWARRRVEALIADQGTGDEEARRKEITELGMAHFLMTPHTSLLVLENDEMYKEFKVNRGREDDWARYAAPKTIPVRVEPAGKGIDLGGATILRTPLEIFQGGGGQLGFDADGDFGGVSFSGATRVDNRFIVGGAEEGEWTGRWRQGDRLGVSFNLAATDAPSTGRSFQATLISDPNLMLTTGELRAQTEPDWTVRESRRAASVTAGPVSTPIGGGIGFGGGGKQGFGTVTSRGLMGKEKSAHWGYYGYGYQNGPVPIAFHMAWDTRLDDLSEQVPGLMADGYDVELARLAVADRKGTVSDAARALIDAARAAQQPGRWTLDGDTLVVDADGRFRLTRTLDTSLGEEVILDGDSLLQIYRELGLVARRPATGAIARLAWLPFHMPPVEELSVFHDVITSGDRTLRLTPVAKGKELAVIELDLDDASRIVAVRAIVEAKTVAETRITREGDKLVVARGSIRQLLTAADGSTSIDVPALDALTVVDVPVAQTAAWQAKVAAAQAGSAEWRHAQRQLLAAYAALGDNQRLWETLVAIGKQGKPTRGELALASRAVSQAPSRKELGKLVKHLGDDPVAGYLLAAYDMDREYRAAAFDTLVAAHPRTLVAMLGRYRGALAAIHGYGGDARARARELAKSTEYGPFRYIVAYTYSNYKSWEDQKGVLANWNELAELPGWRTVANLSAAMALYQQGKYDDSADRYERAVTEALDAGEHPPVTYYMRYAFQSSRRGQAGWRVLWTRWRGRVLREGSTDGIVSLLAAIPVTGEYGDLPQVAAALKGRKLEPEAVVEVASLFQQMGRPNDAWALVRPLVEPSSDGAGEPPAPPLLALAATLAEAQGQTAAAARYLERWLDATAEDEITLAELRTAYRRLFGLHTRLAQSLDTAGSQYLDAALAIATRWRNEDPDNEEIDRLCATAMLQAQRPDDAWRYLSTIVERHPQEGSAWASVAGIFAQEGDAERADQFWGRAVEVEPTNPTWLLSRGQGLLALGREAEANALFRRVADGKWQDRFSNVVWQAKSFVEGMER